MFLTTREKEILIGDSGYSKTKTLTDLDKLKKEYEGIVATKYDDYSLEELVTEMEDRLANDKGTGYVHSGNNWYTRVRDTLDDVDASTEDKTEIVKNLLTMEDIAVSDHYVSIARYRINGTERPLADYDKENDEDTDKKVQNAATTIGRIGEEEPDPTGSTTTDTTVATVTGGIPGTVIDQNGVYHITAVERVNQPVNIPEGAVIGGKVDYQQEDYDPTMLDKRPAWIDTNVEYHRVKTANGFMVDSAFIKRYYSVIDAEVYFGNEYVEDIQDIQWTVQQNVMPLYGYNSYTYDELARGNRLIVGNFTIVFTSPNYLFSILEAANKANVHLVENMDSYEVPKLGADIEPVLRTATYGTRERGHHAAMWPQDFDIDIIYGEKSGAGDPVHVILLGVAIQSCQQLLTATAQGVPLLLEQYQFIAQDLRTSVLAATGRSVASNYTRVQPAEEETGTRTTTTTTTITTTPEEDQAERDKTAGPQQKEKGATEEAEKAKQDEDLTGYEKAKRNGWKITRVVKRNPTGDPILTAAFSFVKGDGDLSQTDKEEWAKAEFSNLGYSYDTNQYELQWTYDPKTDTVTASIKLKQKFPTVSTGGDTDTISGGGTDTISGGGTETPSGGGGTETPASGGTETTGSPTTTTINNYIKIMDAEVGEVIKYSNGTTLTKKDEDTFVLRYPKGTDPKKMIRNVAGMQRLVGNAATILQSVSSYDDEAKEWVIEFLFIRKK